MIMVSATQFFETVPKQDHLGFWADGALNSKKVADFLSFDKKAVATIAGVAAASVRFDHKIPFEVRERLEEIATTISLVAQFFGEDDVKTALWFRTKNPLLGDSSPRELIRQGHYEKLRRFVLAALMESTVTPTASSESSLPRGADHPLIARHRRAIARLCKRFGVRRLAAFGSILRQDFDETAISDVDFAVEFTRVRGLSPARQYFDFKSGLERELDRKVDLVELKSMPESRLKRIVQRTQVPVYGQAA